MEENTYATSIYIDAPVAAVASYLAEGASLTEYTLYSRMQEQVDESTWLGTASGYQTPLYYHSRRHTVGAIEIVEWHCGAEYGKYHHVYPMLVFPHGYFGDADATPGSLYHWISFVDPRRATPMIKQGLPTVHRAEAISLKACIERGRGRRSPAVSPVALRSHTIYVDAPAELVARFLADPENATTWAYMLRRTGAAWLDAYGNELQLTLTATPVGDYTVIEHDRLDGAGQIERSPLLVIPAAFAFGDPAAPGCILHRIVAEPSLRTADELATEAINAKRVLEGLAGNRESYALGCSYVPRGLAPGA